ITYHVGGGPARVHLSVQSDWSLKPLYDVIGVMKGSERPDEGVVRANHRDALAKTGWRPKRTIIYGSWDGEEPGLLGSTEWAETHADELKAKAVLYVNSDTNSRGFLGAGGSHTLQPR